MWPQAPGKVCIQKKASNREPQANGTEQSGKEGAQRTQGQRAHSPGSGQSRKQELTRGPVGRKLQAWSVEHARRQGAERDHQVRAQKRDQGGKERKNELRQQYDKTYGSGGPGSIGDGRPGTADQANMQGARATPQQKRCVGHP